MFLAHSQHAGVVVEETTLRHKLRVPEDLSVLGCGTSLDAVVSSICIPAEIIGSQGMMALLDMVVGNTPKSGAMYATTLNVGITMAKWRPNA